MVAAAPHLAGGSEPLPAAVLAIVTGIAAVHGGTVSAAPGQPSGLVVTLAVPAWREPAKS